MRQSFFAMCVLTLTRCLAFSYWNGVFCIEHPIRKMVRFTPLNNQILDDGRIMSFLYHPPHRRNFTIHYVAPNMYLMVNGQNASDYMIIRQKS